MRPVLDKALSDPDADAVRKSTALAVVELQTLPIVGARVLANLKLVNNTPLVVAHQLGRVPTWVSVSAVRTPGTSTTGQVMEDRSAKLDRSKFISLTAKGFTDPVTVDVLVF